MCSKKIKIKKNIKKKRSLSPVISTVLLVLIVVILVGMLSTWSKDSTQKKLLQTHQNIPAASELECLNSNLDVQSCYIDPTTNHVKLLISNSSNLNHRGISLSIQSRDDLDDTYKITGLLDGNIPPGYFSTLNTYKDFIFIKQDYLLSSLDLNKLDLITLSSRTCPSKVINITDCNQYSTLNEGLVGHWLLQEDGEVLGPELYIGSPFLQWGSGNWTILNNIEGGVELESNTNGFSGVGSDLSMTTGEADHAWFRVQADVNVNSIDTEDLRVFLGSSNGGFGESSYSHRFETYSPGFYNVDKFMQKTVYIDDHPDNILEFSTGTDNDAIANYDVTNISVKQLQTKDLLENNNGSIHGDINYDDYPRGDVNKVMCFDGDQDYINLDLDATYPSFSFWFKTNSSDEQNLVCGVTGGDYDCLGYRYQKLTIADDGGALEKVETDNTYEIDTWYHVALVKTQNEHPNTYKIYVNAVNQDTQEGGGHRASGGSYIGARLYGGEHSVFFNGCMSELRVYNKELTASQIEELYYTTKDRYLIE